MTVQNGRTEITKMINFFWVCWACFWVWLVNHSYKQGFKEGVAAGKKIADAKAKSMYIFKKLNNPEDK